MSPALHPTLAVTANIVDRQRRAMCGRLRVGKKNLHFAALVGAVIFFLLGLEALANSFSYADAEGIIFARWISAEHGRSV
jgi:hypothetical protein